MRAQSRTIRVGTSTNYEFTDAEKRQLETLTRTGDRPFLNTQSSTYIKDHGLPVVVTLNGNPDRFVAPKGTRNGLQRIAACRVKWVAGGNAACTKAYNDSVRWARKRNLPVLVTRMRWFNKAVRAEFVVDTTLYHWVGGQYKPLTRPATGPGIFTCDGNGGGCPECRLCSLLTYGTTDCPYGLNLSESLPEEPSPMGFFHCKHDCTQCWAAKVLKRAGTGGRPKCNVIYRNSKQNGALHKGK
jgi:hypothetical protein